MTARAAFLVDGFNLYHSIREAEAVLHRPLRWLDIRSLCDAQLSAIAATVGRCDVQQIHYYSAFAHHVDAFRPGTVHRHETYVEALRSTGIGVEMAQFKQRERRCPHCRRAASAAASRPAPTDRRHEPGSAADLLTARRRIATIQ
jgi:hypothetical protein